VGQAIFMTGVAFVSGADEALFFDKLQFKKTSAEWRKLITKSSQFALVATTAATIIGAWLHNINPRIPWYLMALSFTSSALVIWSIKEERSVNDKQKLMTEFKEYLVNIKYGFAKFAQRKLFVYLPIIIIVQGLFYATGWGVLRIILLDRFHFSPFMGSLVVASSSLITVVILFIVNKYAERMSEKRVLVSISALAAISLLISIADIGIWGYFVILAFYLGENILHPFMSEILNYQTLENQRATVLSVASFLRAIPYVALAPIIGYLNTHNKLEYFLITWSIFIVVALIIYLLLKKRDVKINLSQEEFENESRLVGL
jgi:MFS family permease